MRPSTGHRGERDRGAHRVRGSGSILPRSRARLGGTALAKRRRMARLGRSSVGRTTLLPPDPDRHDPRRRFACDWRRAQADLRRACALVVEALAIASCGLWRWLAAPAVLAAGLLSARARPLAQAPVHSATPQRSEERSSALTPAAGGDSRSETVSFDCVMAAPTPVDVPADRPTVVEWIRTPPSGLAQRV
jgi:hypothetical protein